MMTENELIGFVFLMITAIGTYGIVGAIVGMIIDVTSDFVLWSCIFLWPIVLPIYVIKCFVKTIKYIWRR